MAQSPLEAISQDLDWREAELGSLKLLLAREDMSDAQRTVLLRASWALLYAHYEGYMKTALTIFYDFARVKIGKCESLPLKTKIIALDSKLNILRSLPSEECLLAIENFQRDFLLSPPTFPEVDTKSNLWPNVLKELLDSADLEVLKLAEHSIKLRTLVSRRNNIAHGKREIIEELEYYRSFENAVYDLMYELAYRIDDRLKLSPYL